MNEEKQPQLIVVRCPSCGRALGKIYGLYSIRCGKCRAHPIVKGDTTKQKYTNKNKI